MHLLNLSSPRYRTKMSLIILLTHQTKTVLVCLSTITSLVSFYLHIHQDVTLENPRHLVYVAYERNDGFCALEMNTFLILSSVLVTLRREQDTKGRRERVIVCSLVEDGLSNETWLHQSGLLTSARSATGQMNPRQRVRTAWWICWSSCLPP